MHLLAVNPLDAQSLIQSFGVAGVLLIVFAETGLLVGFFLPGDTLLFLSGVAASGVLGDQLHVPLAALLIGSPIAAVVGAETGYQIGRRAGPALFQREDSPLFRHAYLERAERIFARFGPMRSVVLARFVPLVRTVLNPVAGTLRMRHRDFSVANVVGGVVWTVGITLLGWGLGRSLGSRAKDLHIDRYILPVVAVIVVVSAAIVVRELRKPVERDQPVERD